MVVVVMVASSHTLANQSSPLSTTICCSNSVNKTLSVTRRKALVLSSTVILSPLLNFYNPNSTSAIALPEDELQQEEDRLVHLFQQNALRYLVGHALNKIQFIPSALYTELDEESDNKMPKVFICYPGNEVPEWFTFQSTGSFVIVKHLPQGWFSDNLVGLAICAVVAFQHHYDDGRGLVLVCKCEFESEDGCRHVARGYFAGWGNDKYGIHYVGSDHVFLGYDFVMYPRNFGEYYYTNKFSVQFYIEDNYSECIHSCEVKKCGVRLIYRHEFGNSILSTSSDEDYFCKYLEEEIPHGPHKKSSKLSASYKNRMQIKDELILSSEARLLERVSGGDIRSQALRTPDHLKRGCVGGMGEQRLVELEDTEQVNNNMRRESNKEQSNLAKRKWVEEYSIEECMQMIEELDVDDDVFAKLMEKFVSLEWRKIFLTMSEKRRKTWVQRL
ncbi:hypothetical protein LWI29_016076 [Acer saccharum]|uniref:C-JID domain-containing protein n=1 Tax=Acer saccharum TaxID=4024 RepID=A0AA39RUF6_ACESA|nr:hypothetical protein LWI29_016076 [Acer saccharum]